MSSAQPVTVCNFCLKRVEVVLAANAVAICASCLFESYVALGKTNKAWWGAMLSRIVQECPPEEGELLAEPVARGVARFFAGDIGALQKSGEALAARDTTAFWRAVSILLGAISPAHMTAQDARRLIYAALFAGDFARAATIEPARTAERDDRCLRCHHHVVALLRATPGSAEAMTQRDLVIVLCRDKAKTDIERAITAMTEAFAHVRAGDAARGLAAYAPYRDEADLRPWHRLEIGDALATTGDAAGARAAWNMVADRTGWEPYWPGRARERLGGAPYR